MLSASQLLHNLRSVRQRIDDAARRGGRRGEEVSLIAVTKYIDAEAAAALLGAGCRDLGESRPQELWHKAEQLAARDVRWHLVGHLQRNKVRRTLPHVALIHSVDSLRLLEEIDRQAQSLDRAVPVLLEVNVSGDAAKHGFDPADMPGVVRSAVEFPRLRIRGLMTMAAREGDLTAARSDFRRLRELRDELRAILPPSQPLDELSMGMSGDFEVAVEEGATLVRIGSALFAA
jgi:pyridoxal phosphate enzyme (YggS family)